MIVRVTVAEALARVLASVGVPCIYGIPGGKMTPLLKAVSEAEVPFVGVRHEASAGLMATAEGMLGPVPAVVVAEQAPGLANLLAGLGAAFANGLGVVALTVSTPRAVAGRGAMMEVDAQALFRPLVKASYQVMEPRRAAELVRRALGLRLIQVHQRMKAAISIADWKLMASLS